MKNLLNQIRKDLGQLVNIIAIVSTKIEYKVDIKNENFDLLMDEIRKFDSVKNSIENDFTLTNGLNLIFWS